MLYPLKFKPVYKDYIWGGRNLEKLGKQLPDGIVAESWEISCHLNGVSVVANGEYEGIPLTELVGRFGKGIMGNTLYKNNTFPLLIKLIDANDKLSVQVHPGDNYANKHENGSLGKNEMWYIISAKPGAKLIYNVKPGVTKEFFAEAVKENRIDDCLNQIEVYPGDFINIPAGIVHAIGEGIVLAEVQQNSDTTYRVYDYDRVDAGGNKRPLHIEKALDVIEFSACSKKQKAVGLEVKLEGNSLKRYMIANRYFSIESYKVDGEVSENADGSKFYIYIITEGEGKIIYGEGFLEIKTGESVLIPAALGEYSLSGRFDAIKAYVPEIERDVTGVLMNAGYSKEEIFNKVEGIK